MLTTEREHLKKELSKCENVKQVFQRLEAIYDLENCKLGTITKALFIEGAIKGIALMKPKMK